MYIAARLILGFGIPPCLVSGSSLIGELGYPKVCSDDLHTEFPSTDLE